MSTGRKPGRRPGDPEVTRQAILAAARSVFSDAGFERATIRGIASRAGVDPALIHHHFGAKQELFIAAHQLPFDPAQLIESLQEVPPEQRGEQIVRMYLNVFGLPDSPALSLLRAATTNESAARMLREFLQAVLLDNAVALTNATDARLRVALIGSHMIGVLFARNVVGVPELSERSVEELVTVLAPTVDRYLNTPDLSVG